MFEQILTATCAHFGITKQELCTRTGRRQTMRLVEAKQIAAYLLYNFGHVSYAHIAALTGYTNKAAITYNIDKIRDVALVNKEVRQQIISLEEQITATMPVAEVKKQLSIFDYPTC